jgi:uncharacterized protein YecA (UPF0149 family)
LNSPYENAKRLERECVSLGITGEKFLLYLDKIQAHDNSSEQIIMSNYEEEFEKVETLSQLLINMVTSYKSQIQQRLLTSFTE